MTKLVVSGIPIELEKKRIKRMNIRITPPTGQVRVSAPWYVSDEAIADFIRRNEAWIRRQQARLAAEPLPVKREFVTGDIVELWGKPYSLLLETCSGACHVELEEDRIVIYAPQGCSEEKRKALLKEWYRALLASAVESAMPVAEGMTGLKADSWQIKTMKTRWGSCNARTKKVWLSLYLCQKPPQCLLYVLVHELCHVKVSNHGPDFKALMNVSMPDWKERKALLNRPDTYMVYF